MSANTFEPASEGPRNPKADAKAAKAYAKAMRPWYKKKRVIIPAGLVALAMAGAASSGSDSGAGSASSGSASSSSASSGSASSGRRPPRTTPLPGGQAVTNAGTTYKVTSAKTTDTIGDPDMFRRARRRHVRHREP